MSLECLIGHVVPPGMDLLCADIGPRTVSLSARVGARATVR
jgi:hypothetical protein